MLIFWTYAFPIILGLFFHLAFSNIESSEQLDLIDIAVVENAAFKQNLVAKETIKVLSDEGGDEQLFHTRYVDENQAKQLLEKEEISGYLIVKEDKLSVVVAASGIDETILKNVADEISQTGKLVKVNPDAVINASQEMKAHIRDVSPKHLSYTMIEFYTLIAMACLYGGMIGMTAMNQNLPNMTNMGKRVSVSPVGKMKLVLGSVLAGYIVQLVGVGLLFLFTIFALKVDYGTNLGLVILLAIVGSLAGLSIGIAVGALLKTGENAKIGVMIAFTMVGCYLSGMMGITMKYIVDTHIPFLNKINPAGMITDGYYALYYYNTTERYFFDVGSLLIFSGVMIALAFTSLRRQTYDSI